MKFFARLITIYLVSCFNVMMTEGARDGYNKHLLNDVTFRVSAFEFPPIMKSHLGARGNVTYTGLAIDTLQLMIEYFNMRIEYVPVNPAEVKKYGVGIPLIHQLKNNEVDYAPFTFRLILNYSLDVDLCYPMSVEDYILMQPFPKEVSRLSAPIIPFTNEVWLFFILSIVIFTIVVTVVVLTRNRYSDIIIQQRRQSHWEKLYQGFQYALTIITAQVFRLMVALWLLSMVVLVNAYIGKYTANLSVPKLEPTVDTLEDLAASRKLKMTVEFNSDISFDILNADSGPNKILGDSLRKNPELLITNTLDAMLNVAKKDCVYPGPVNIVNYFINADLKASGECRMTTATKPLPYFVSISTALQKGSPYTETYNREFMLRVWENGILERLRKQAFKPMPKRCQPWGQQKQVGNTPLKLKEFFGIFVLYIGGCITAVVLFLAELFIARLK